jgi:site-specific DNA-methyltransferase (adenine-specific)
LAETAELVIEMRDLASLRPFPKNYQRHSPEQIALLGQSLRDHGQTKNVVITADGMILAGHGLAEAAQFIGWKRIACGVYRGQHPESYVVADNFLATLAEPDEAALAALLQELQDVGELAASGYDEAAFSELIASLQADVPPVEEGPIPEPQEGPTRVQPGEVWALGKHRVMCGDCTKGEDVARLMEGRKARLFATDPPYGVSYGDIAASRPAAGLSSPDRGRIENDDLNAEEFQAWLTSAFLAIRPHLEDDAAWYLWHAQKTQGYFTAAAAAAAVLYHRQIVWVKPSLILGRGDYHWRHELCLYGWVQGNRPPWLRGRDQDTVWEIAPREGAASTEDHPTPKPPRLWEIPIQNHLSPGEICLDAFAGSGPAVIAAESMQRTAYCMEIMPRYCDVILARWEAFTGQQAVRCD